MPIITEIQTISETIGKIIDFVQNNEKTKEDFEEYIKTIGATNASQKQLQAACIPYITERILFKENKSVPELFVEQSVDLSNMEKDIAQGLNNSISSIFEIKKRLNNGFVMYNFVNERTYTVIPLVKMTQLREVYPSQFALVRIFKFNENYYVLEISDLIPSYEKDNVMNFAVAKIIEKPEDLYFDNPEKFEEVKAYVEKSVSDFNEFFGTNEIVTTNKKIDELVNIFDNYQKTLDDNLKTGMEEYIENSSKFGYFEVKEFSNSYDSFLEKSMQGFSAHKETYDVGYLADEKLGIYIIPFWATLCEIFTSKDYKTIENYKECVDKFIKNDKIPPSFIDRLKEKSKIQGIDFEERLNEITGESSDEIIKKYKADYLKKTIFSSSNVLYCSKTFCELVEK